MVQEKSLHRFDTLFFIFISKGEIPISTLPYRTRLFQRLSKIIYSLENQKITLENETN